MADPRLLVPSHRPGRSARARLIAAGALVLIGFIALREHDAHVRQATELKQLKRQTATDVAVLRDQAARALRQANAQVEEIQGLESRRRALEQRAEQLREQLASLQAQESREAGQVATLPTPEVAMRVATRLGIEERGSGLGGRGSENSRGSVPESRNANPESLLISGDSLRKIDAALVELDACRGESTVRDQQEVNCREQVENDTAIIDRQAASINELHQAVAAKDQILARREAELQAELKAARGSRIGRIGRTLKYVAMGVAIGVVIR